MRLTYLFYIILEREADHDSRRQWHHERLRRAGSRLFGAKYPIAPVIIIVAVAGAFLLLLFP